MKNKKGISPLIATVLVIGFTIALTLVVFTWGKGFTETLTEGTGEKAEQQLRCLESDFVSYKISGACYDWSSKSVRFNFENTGDNYIYSASLRIIGESADHSQVLTAPIRIYPLNIKLINMTFRESYVKTLPTRIEVLKPRVYDSLNRIYIYCPDYREELRIYSC